jgi:plastocyanin
MRTIALASALLLVGLPGAACFSDRSPVMPPSETDLCAEAQPGVVRIRDFAFQPSQIRVSRGTRVTWVNCDTDAHTSTADAGAWSSPLLARQASFSETFDAPGQFSYHCQPHPFMTATVIVE